MRIIFQSLFFMLCPMFLDAIWGGFPTVLLLVLNLCVLAVILILFLCRFKSIDSALLSINAELSQCRSVANQAVTYSFEYESGDSSGEHPLKDRQPSDPAAEEAFLDKLNYCIEKNISSQDFSVNTLARELCVSRSSLFAKVKDATGETPNNLLTKARLIAASKLLEQDEKAVNEISYMVGFSSPSYFSRCFVKFYGVTPHQWANTKRSQDLIMQ